MTSQPAKSNTFIYVDSDEKLQAAAHEWTGYDCVALDTEFMRVTTFYPQAALFQIGTPEHCFLIDPLPISNFTPLVELLEIPEIVKVMHSCSEDLEVFNVFLKCQPQAIFDTQVGAAFLGYGLSIGYKNLVDGIFDVDLPKGEQRSDWLQRPLSQKQLAYAAQDVTYLIDLYNQQLSALQGKGRVDWVRQECEVMLNKQRRNNDPTEAYLKIKGINRLTLEQLQIAHKLAEWREIEARSRNIPRGFLLKDQQLLEIAQRQPANREALARTEDIRRRVVREDGDQIIDLVEHSRNAPPQVPLMPEPLPPRAKPLIRELQVLLTRIAESAGLIPELLLSRRTLVTMLTELAAGGEARLPAELPQWKQDLFGDQLLALLAAMKGKI